MVDENARLASRLEKSLQAAQEHAESVGVRMAKDEKSSEKLVRRLQSRVDELEARESLARAEASSESAEAMAAMQARLRDSERRNRELQDYVKGIRASYDAAFGEEQEDKK